MMDHLDEGSLQALLDGELPPLQAGDARRHLATCARCDAAYEGLSRSSARVESALALLDPERPRVLSVMQPPSARARRPRRGLLIAPRAALLLLGVAAVGSATVPGSPVRGWIESRLRPAEVAVALQESLPRGEETAAEPRGGRNEAGVSTEPLEGELRILLTRSAAGLPVQVMLTDSPRGGAFAVGDSARAGFQSRAGLVEVIGASGGELRVEIPRTARDAVVEIDGRPFVTKRGDELHLVSGAGSGSELRFTIP